MSCGEAEFVLCCRAGSKSGALGPLLCYLVALVALVVDGEEPTWVDLN